MKNIKKDFPLLMQDSKLIYLDNAATTQKPQVVIDALTSFYTTSNANIARGVYKLQERSTQLYEQARSKVAAFIGAHDDEVVFTKSTTDSINCVAAAWGNANIKSGDSIVVTEMEHHSNLLPWQRLAQEKGAQLNYIPVRADGTLDLTQLDTLITPITKLVAVTQVSNALGTVNDILTIITRAHMVGAKVLIDAAQSIAHQQIDVATVRPDFLVFSGHKMLGPTGIGVLYVARHMHDNFPPYQLGGGMVYMAGFTAASWRSMPQRLEAGTPPIAEAVALGVAIDYIKDNIDYAALHKHEALLTARLIDALRSMPRIRLLGPLDQLSAHGHMVSFIVDGMHAHDVAAYLDTFSICVRAGNHCAQPLALKMGYDASVRVSFYCYNTLSDVDALIGALGQMLNA